jgi:hypothetical protein
VALDQVRILRQTPDYGTGGGIHWVDVTLHPPDDGPAPNYVLRSVHGRDDQLGTYVIALYDPESRVLTDLATTVSFTPNAIQAEKEVSVTATVTNHGPRDATKVRLFMEERYATGTILSSSVSQGTCDGSTSRLNCLIGDLPEGKSATITFLAKLSSSPDPYGNPLEGWTPKWEMSFEASTTESDPVEDNNRATAAIIVERGQNQYPFVEIRSPDYECSFVNPSDIPIEIEASDPDGTVSEVAVYESDRLLGYAFPTSGNRYKFVWHATENGFHSLSATAKDNQGWKSSSGGAHNLYLGPLAVSVVSPKGTELDGDLPIVLQAIVSSPTSDLAKVEIVTFGENPREMQLVSGSPTSSSYKFVWTKMRSGNSNIFVVATDSAGIPSRSSLLSIKIHKSPSVEAAASLDDNGLIAKRSVFLTTYVNDPVSEPRSVEFLVNGRLVGKRAFEPELMPGTVRHTSIEWTPPVAGTYTLKAVVTNEDGSKLESAPVSMKAGAVQPNP